MITAQENGWPVVISDIVREAAEMVGFSNEPIAGSDGGGVRWAWPDYSHEDRTEEVVLQASPDTLGTGIQTVVIAVARMSDPRLTWSATIASHYIDAGAFDGHPHQESLARFRDELPRNLDEARQRTSSTAPELEQRYEEKQRRDRDLAERLGGLLVEELPEREKRF